MSVATRLQAMQPTDIGVPGPTSWDMARAFRSVRADPLTFLGEVSQRYGDLVSFPVPGPPALLLNDPADVRHVLQTSARNWGKQTVQYAALARVTGPGPARLGRAELDRAPAARRPGLPPPAARGGGRPGAAAADAPPSRARLGGPHAAAVADGAVVDVAAADPPHRPRRRRPRAVLRRPVRPRPAAARRHERGRRPGGAARPLGPAHRAEWTPTRTNLRLRADPPPPRRRSPPQLIAERRARTPAPAGRPTTATTSSGCSSTAAWPTARSATSSSPWSSPATRPWPPRSPGP